MIKNKAPFKVIFSNDTTNIETCTSPYSPYEFEKNPKTAQPFTPEMLEGTVDETVGTGIEVHLLQPGVGWVPWWNSKAYPYQEHVKFLKERFGMDPSQSGFAQYMANGGDIVKVFVDRCREKGIVPFVSFRLNDSHGHEYVNAPREELRGFLWHCLTPIHVNHPEWRLGEDLTDWNNRVLNWTIPEVRKLKFKFIEEIIEQYDIDGFELDFMRHNNFFKQDETTSEQRLAIMSGFVRQVRETLDRTAKDGHHKWLCVRIPCHLSGHDSLGIDIKTYADAGVDMFNLCSSFFTEQQSDMQEIVRIVPDKAVYLESTSAAAFGESLGPYDQSFWRMTDNQYYTLAHLVYSRGGSGVSAFNFVYYRPHHGNPDIGPFNEPPFHVFNHAGDPDWLAKQPQHYFLGVNWSPYNKKTQLTQTLAAGQSVTFALDMAPPTGGWKKGGRFRIQAAANLDGTQWKVTLNGTELTQTQDCSEPYETPYTNCLGSPQTLRAWVVKPETLIDGDNKVEVAMLSGGGETKLVFLDFGIE
ncbi:MAG: hypothetical protein FWD23_07010 [Oscillospiraceae bacterium]|nr:hypothetical protein [Oscillospiraceae bacterium]